MLPGQSTLRKRTRNIMTIKAMRKVMRKVMVMVMVMVTVMVTVVAVKKMSQSM